MKTKFISIFIVITFSVKAQIPTINQSSLPLPGDTFAYVVDLNPNITFNFQQTNATWNFSTLQNDSVKFASYGITSQLPFASNFPNSNLYTYGPGFLYGGLGGGAPYTNNFGYMMFNTYNLGFYVIGFRSDFGFGYTNVLIQPNELLMKTPFTYNDSIFHASTWEIVFNSVPNDYDTIYKRYTFKYLKAVGYGTLTTPYASFQNCLAVKEYIRYYDTIEVKYGTFTITKFFAQSDTIFNVHVWSANKRNNLLTANYNPYTMACNYIEYLNYEDLNVITVNEHKIKLHMYPNPIKSGEKCNINFKASKAHIYNMKGKLVASIDIQNQTFFFPSLPNSNYIIQFMYNNSEIYKTPIMVINP